MALRTIVLERRNWAKWTAAHHDFDKDSNSDTAQQCSELLISRDEANYFSESEGIACLSLVEDVVEFGPGGRIWDAAIVLANFLFSEVGSAQLKNRHVLEIGAGAGLTSIVSALLGASLVRATDKEFVLPLLSANAARVAPEQFANSLIRVETLEWGQRLGGRKRRRGSARMLDLVPDMVIASDVLGCGDSSLYPPLLKTMLDLCEFGAPILMTYKPRAIFELQFFLSAQCAGFEIRRLGRATLPQSFSPIGSGLSGTESFQATIDVLEFRLTEMHEDCKDNIFFTQDSKSAAVLEEKDFHNYYQDM